jgi:3-dehydroquinate synthase
MPTVVVAPAGQEPYDLLVERGALGALARAVGEGTGAVALVADARVFGLWGERARAALAPTHRRVVPLIFPDGEASKTRETWARLTDALVAAGVGRDGVVVGLGGGVTTDLAGFVAATYARGVPWVAAPTTLLGMVDAAVGGKTGVDLPAGKNLVGAFHHPRAVVADVDALATLGNELVDCGVAEMVKHLLVGGGGAADFAALARWRASGPAWLDDAADHVAASVAIKAAVVREDPQEAGRRAVLNLGHTVGHALERVSGYDLPHGLAVAIGLAVEARITVAAGLAPPEVAVAVAAALAALGLPARLPAGVAPAAVLAATAVDKKGLGGRARYALLAGVGRPARGPAGWTHDVPDAVVLAALEASR